MTDKQRAAKLSTALTALKKTTEGYKSAPTGTYWRTAIPLIEAVIDDLQVPPIPALGPIVKGGRSILNEDCTHLTDGLDWPAFDTMGKAGTAVVAPEACVVYDNTSGAQGGEAFYIRGSSGIEYWIGHITTVPALNKRFRKGEILTRISSEHARPHCHLGIDARKLLGGKHLQSHQDYTHGAPKIGVQLQAAAYS